MNSSPSPIPPILTIVGKSGSGKTTLIEKLLPEFRQRGYRVGTVKHHLHDFDIDYEGKDSWRHARAGAETIIVASPQKVAMVKHTNADISLEEMRDVYFRDVDLIIAEGYKISPHFKVEVFRRAVHEHPLYCDDATLLATLSDSDIETGAPRFGLEEILPLVDLLENLLLRTPEQNKT